MSSRYLFIFPLLMFSGSSFSQSRLVMTGASHIVIDHAAKLVVENPASNAVSTTGSGGIMTESEFDQVIWNVGVNTGTYVVPFVSQAPVTQIPFTLSIVTAGTGAGRMLFSTYPGAVADNNTYRPSDVTHMFDHNTGSVNNSSHTIDRFWIADASGYVIKPAAVLEFTYRDSEHLQSGNAIVEASLGAQRFNSSTNQWGDYLPQGTTNTATNTTANVPASPGNFFRSWTLSEVSNPLAVELNYFKASCSSSGTLLAWQTASETDIDHFEIEYYDQQQFRVIGFIQPTGSGTGTENYTFQPSPAQSGVFRLAEVTTDGNRIIRSSVSATCDENTESTVSYNSDQQALNLRFEGESESAEPLQIYDAGGKLVFETLLEITKGMNAITLPDLFLSPGMYIVRLKNGRNIIAEKVLAAN